MNRIDEKINITCGGEDFISLSSIVEFQGELKKRTKQDIEMIKTSILKYGFTFPLFVWKHNKKHYCLDGHGRIECLKQMEKQGTEIPLLPVCYIQAKDEEEAKQKLLRVNSQYGKITLDGFNSFVGDISINYEEINIPGIALEETNPYTDKINIPLYEPTGEKPDITELIDNSITQKLMEEIEEAEITDEERVFLWNAAQRHLVFKYSEIAEYYAHAGKVMQGLMEKSALVIIDFNKAIEQGFVQISKEIIEGFNQDG